jgi:diguanylate cyclase (GGDEF)-like protein
MRLPTLSIRSMLLAAIVVGVVLPALMVLLLDQHLARSSQEPVVQRNRAAVMALASAALTEPAWTLSLPAIQQAVDRILQEPSVCAIDVLDLQPSASPLTVARDTCERGSQTVSMQTLVMHEGQSSARLRLVFDGSEIDRQLAERRYVMVALVTAQVLFGVAVLAGVLSLRLLRPISRLKAQAGQLAAREPMPPHEWPQGDELGELGQHLNTVHGQVRELITELERKNDQLHRMAMFDHLTGLPNRTLLRELFAREAALARRSSTPLALLFVDLDQFKTVNDRFGHSAGDDVLVQMARRLRQTLRESDLVCRISGDEFLCLLSCPDGSEQVRMAAERLVVSIQEPMLLPAAPEPVRVGASVGVALYPHDGADFDALVRAADVAMYHSKQLGRGRCSFYHPEMDAQLRGRLDLESELGQAIEHGELRLHYQPVVDASDGRIVGCEALVRWQHPRRGLLGPDLFIPLAESTGLVRPLGRWVLETACAQLAQWQQQGQTQRQTPGQAGLEMAINVSALQLHEAAFVDDVARAIGHHRLAAGSLTLELTESTLLNDSEGALRAVAALRRSGVRLAVDDFGTGYSSLATLKQVRPDRVKIDRSFVHDLPGGSDDAALVEAMFGMAGALGIAVVAEGVETVAQRDWLLQRGGRLQQGWLWSRALPAAELEPLLGRRLP